MARDAKRRGARQVEQPTLGTVCRWFWQERGDLYRPRVRREGERALEAAIARFGSDSVPQAAAVQRWLRVTKARNARRWLNAAYNSARLLFCSRIENPVQDPRAQGDALAGHRYLNTTQRYARDVLGVRQQTAERRRPGRQRERGSRPLARPSARRHLLHAYTSTTQAYAAQVLAPATRAGKRRTKRRRTGAP